MKAITVEPKKAGSAQLEDIQEPDSRDGSVLAGIRLAPVDADNSGNTDPDEMLDRREAAIAAIETGKYPITQPLSLTVDHVTLRGEGMDSTVLSFAGLDGSGEGLLVQGDDFTLQDIGLEDTPKNVEALRAVAPTIVFTNSTNRELGDPRADDWAEVERLVLAEKARWEASGTAEEKR